ncbi:ABC transporter ATP-binding protein [Pseudaminobacter sp. 19-2017]|uniref:ABC transporter ATP-binding protein n=1 Tax=Pseudaminobacter soli (ex Zhang et al. 2022) TaxID=2831468 RepID=A0A942E0S1_9HYPH|nr:ABC transporter ATP-binding protein [Pseudaminobacter soli]MBS3649058.1 ABC transporter ATP-binding protein [Pseudaminobacter soli]
MKNTGLPLRLEGVSKRYGKYTALTPTDLTVAAGEFLTLLGPSGSGKTTLLNLIAGYLEPMSGTIEIGSRDVTRLPARQRNIGMVFQSYALFPHMTVGQNIGYGLAVRGVSKAESTRRVSEVLSLMRLEGYADRPIQKMSGGQQQRVALARALVIEPDVLLMDEPLSALDKQLRRTVQLELRRLHQEHGRTTIYVTHDQEEALVLSDRIAVMDQGRIQQLGTVDDIYDRPANAFVAGFIGESNLLPVKVNAVAEGKATTEVEAFRRTIVAPAAPGVEAGQTARLLLRPEHLLLNETDDGVPAEIIEAVYLGELSQYGLALESGQVLTARRITDRSLRTGMKVSLSWDPGHARVVPEN